MVFSGRKNRELVKIVIKNYIHFKNSRKYFIPNNPENTIPHFDIYFMKY